MFVDPMKRTVESLGWTCPKCGRVYSPTVRTCDHCNKKNENKPIRRPLND